MPVNGFRLRIFAIHFFLEGTPVSVTGHHTELHSACYHLVGADIRVEHELKEKLDSCGIDCK